MTAQAIVKDSFTFVGGLNTEGGYFVTPENSWKEGVNVIPSTDGSVERRNGIDYEDLFGLYAAGITEDQKNTWAYTVGTWSTVAGIGTLNFFVVQLGPTLHFYEASSGAVSASKKSFTVNLTSYKASGNTETDGTAVASFASTYGRLIVTTANTEPLLIEYNVNTDDITVSQITLRMRDFEGFKSPYAVDAEKTEAEWGSDLTKAKYNLYNQGWTDTLISTYKSANSNKLPSNTKSWIFGKNSDDNFDAALLNKQDFGTSPAPKGRYILDAFYKNRSGIIESIAYRPTVCAFFAGRVWYAGVKADKQLGTVYFSQVLDDITKAGYCYQTNDPASEIVSDLLDSDGGVIQIPEAGEIVGLQPLGRGIAVISSTGVWFVSGIDSGFSAASYSVERITNVGCTSPKSIVAIEDSVLYWSNTGIYTIAPGQTGAEFSAQNISDKNIKSFYQNIPVVNKLYAEGSYNVTNKIIYWFYSNVALADNSIDRYVKNTVLALDARLGSWYWFEFDTSLGVLPVSLEVTKETTASELNYNVIVGSTNVLVSTNEVVATIPVINGTSQQFKFLVLHPTGSSYSVTFADMQNTRSAATKFKDWYSYNTQGVEQDSYVVTGYNIGGNGPARQKTGQYLTVFMKRTETGFDGGANPINPSSCKLQVRWDFTDNNVPGKWQDEVQVYRQNRPFFALPGADFDDGYPVVISKNKLRGRGKAAQFRFHSEAGHDMKVVGWTGTFIGNQNV
jgi:hypothetical protein